MRTYRLVGKKKKNSGLPSDVQSTQVAFNSVFINELKQDLSSSKKNQGGMGNMSTPDLINLAVQHSHILVESPKGRQIKFLIINSSS